VDRLPYKVAVTGRALLVAERDSGTYRRHRVRAQSTQREQQQASSAAETTAEASSELGFLLKLFVLSTVGAAAVKYGSLVIDTPFQPNAAVAFTLITAPCLVYAVIMLAWSKSDSPSI
jgi:Flp pilus assembly protein protease CpaA